MGELSSIKAGDFVMMDVGGSWRTDLRRLRVERVTKLHIVVNGEKFRFSGSSVGGTTWSKRYIRPYDEAEYLASKKENERLKIASRLMDVRWKDLDHDLLKRVSNLIPAAVDVAKESH